MMGGGEAAELGYWMRWEVLVCAVIFIAPSVAAAVVIARNKGDALKAGDFWVPCWRGMSPLWLLGYRIAAFLVLLWFLLQMVLVDGFKTFLFYTQWTFTLVIVYFLIAISISAHGCWVCSKRDVPVHGEGNGFLENVDEDSSPSSRTKKDAGKLLSRNEGEASDRRAAFWLHVMQAVYQICAGAVMLTDVVFWGLLVPTAPDHFHVDFVMACVHSLNAVLLLLDTSVNNLTLPWFGMAYFVLWSGTFVAFQWVIHALGFPWWPYPFLDLGNAGAPLWYLAVGLVHVPCYYFYFWVVKAKNSCLPALFPHAYVRS